MAIHTYPEMNETIKDLLRRSEEPMNLYIVARIEELEKQLAAAERARRNQLTHRRPMEKGAPPL